MIFQILEEFRSVHLYVQRLSPGGYNNARLNKHLSISIGLKVNLNYNKIIKNCE